MIHVRQLEFQHPHTATAVFDDVTFGVPKGSLAVVLGPNGSGKTTLFKCMAAIWRPSAGRILIQGRDTRALSWRQRARLLAVVPQEHVPPFAYPVLEVVLMGRAPHLGLYAAPGRQDRRIALETLERLGIAHLAGQAYTRISGGERQLVLTARALAQQTPVLLLDEPTAHLDFRNQYTVLTLIRRVAAEKGLTVLTTLHDPNLAAGLAHKVILLKSGRIMAAGTPDKILTAANLERLYDIGIRVARSDGRWFIRPRIEEKSEEPHFDKIDG